jgi:hypothetical protein
MTALRRFAYLAYYLSRMDWSRLWKFARFVYNEKRISFLYQALDCLQSSIRHNVSPLEYYQFHFFDQSFDSRLKWAGTGFMYEFQLSANPPKARSLLADKRRFYAAYRKFFKHQMIDLDEFERNPERAVALFRDNSILVCKASFGNCGRQVAFFETTGKDISQLRIFLNTGKYDLVETFAPQHESLCKLSPSAVNTVRIFTMLNDKHEVAILGCRLRISVNCRVDNLAAGNLAAPIDELTGIVTGPGVYSDITRPDEPIHPITKVPIIGFQVPYWQETLKLAKEAALLHPQNRSIGWDIVVTPEGPGLIEGNHDWCKLVWQLPVRQGLKHLLA